MMFSGEHAFAQRPERRQLAGRQHANGALISKPAIFKTIKKPLLPLDMTGMAHVATPVTESGRQPVRLLLRSGSRVLQAARSAALLLQMPQRHLIAC